MKTGAFLLATVLLHLLPIEGLLALSSTDAEWSTAVLSYEDAKREADSGDAYAQAVVSIYYSLGWKADEDPKLALEYATASAKAGNLLGIYRVGVALANGDGAQKDEARGLELLKHFYEKTSEEQKNPYVTTARAIIIFQGKIFDNTSESKAKRYADAASLYRQAADMGYAPAQFNFAVCAKEGHGMEKTPGLYKTYLSQALNESYPPAQRFALENGEFLETTTTSTSDSQKSRSSTVEGYSQSGERWAYEFLEPSASSAKVGELWSLESERLLLANDEWIVAGSFNPLGLGRGKTIITFYDARSLLPEAVVSVPNGVLHVDWSPDRQQFLAITTRGEGNQNFVKHPDDLAQALVLIDLTQKQIERFRLWGPAQDEDWNYAEYCSATWNLDLIEFEYENNNPNKSLQPQGSIHPSQSAFAGISEIASHSRKDPFYSSIAADPSSLDAAGIASNVTKLHEAFKSHSGHSYTGMDEDMERYSQASSQQVIDGQSKGLNIVRPSLNGSLFSLNLSKLTHHVTPLKNTLLEGAGIFADGTLHAFSGDKLYLSSNGQIVIKTLNTLAEENSRNNGNGSGEIAPYIPVFDERAVYYFPKTQPLKSDEAVIARVDSHGEEVLKSVKLSDLSSKDTTENWDFYPNRQSVGVVVRPNDSFLDRVFREYSWADGTLLSGPIDAATGKGYFDYKVGFAPAGWLIESYVTDASTDGIDFAVNATEIATGKRHLVATGGAAYFSEAPVMTFRNATEAQVLSMGTSAARLDSLDTQTGASKTVNEWTWDVKDGLAIYDPSKSWFFVPLPDGYRIYQPFGETPSAVLADIFFEGEDQYVIVLPDGRYAGSPGCERMISLKTGDDDMVTANTLAPWRNRPAEVLQELGGATEDIELLRKVTERWFKRIRFDPSTPEPKFADLPKVTITARPPLWSDNKHVEIPLQWQSGGSPVEKISVRVNGVESAHYEGGSLGQAQDGTGSLVAKVALTKGHNWIEVTAEDSDGRQSNLQRFRTILEQSPSPSKRFVVALGVSEYARPELNLEFAAKDAKDLLEAFKGSDPSTQTKALLLTNKSVDQTAIAQIRDFLKESSEDDEVILFCAGHGVLDENLDYLYAGHDFDPDRAAETGIKLDDLVDAVSSAKSLKRLILLDTCHAGTVGEKDEFLLAQTDAQLPTGVRAVAQRGMQVKEATDFSSAQNQRFIEEMFLLPGLHRGVNIIGASGGAQFALESDVWSNGVFTASVIEGLRDKKADQNQDGRVMVSELKNYLGQRVPELTANAQKPSVVAYERDQDFNLLEN